MGPLEGIRIIELASIGPGPFCGMMLADLGAEVIRVERKGTALPPSMDPLSRNRKSLACDLKKAQGIEVLMRLVATADGLIEGYRPGVAERLGAGPDACIATNPALVYGRMTGWGQYGPLAQAAGHDLNYIALTGALNAIGPVGGKPVPPLNLVGDFGGGGLLLAYGMLCALLSAARTGAGQVVDAAMVDGANSMMAMFHGLRAMGLQSNATGADFLSGAAHFYDTYETKDDKYISIAAIEPQFYALLIDKLGLDRKRFAPHVFAFNVDDKVRAKWAELKVEIAEVVRSRTRSEWCDLLEGSDVCFAPVLDLDEARKHPHNVARRSFVDVGGRPQPAPSPRFSRTPAEDPQPAVAAGAHSLEILRQMNFGDEEIASLIESETVFVAGD